MNDNENNPWLQPCVLALYSYDGDGVNKNIICKQTQLLSPIYFPVK